MPQWRLCCPRAFFASSDVPPTVTDIFFLRWIGTLHPAGRLVEELRGHFNPALNRPQNRDLSQSVNTPPARWTAEVTAALAPSVDSPPRDAVCCKALRSGAWLIRGTTRHQASRGEHDSRAAVHRRLPADLTGHGDSQALRPCRRRNAPARSRPHCRQRYCCSLRSTRRLSGVSFDRGVSGEVSGVGDANSASVSPATMEVSRCT